MNFIYKPNLFKLEGINNNLPHSIPNNQLTLNKSKLKIFLILYPKMKN